MSRPTVMAQLCREETTRVDYDIAYMGEVVCASAGAASGNQFADPALEMWNASLGGLAQKRLQFANDRIEVRRIF